jgi:prepilin-type N-terminal cleavage/methylation domain-containing protein
MAPLPFLVQIKPQAMVAGGFFSTTSGSAKGTISDRHSTAKGSAGFTLVEMMVVISIMAIVSLVVITGQSTYNRTLLLTDTAYTVAFSIRQAQSLGISSRTFGSDTNVGYGITFSSGARDRYTVFADTSNASLPIPSTCATGTAGTPEWKPGNCRYNSGDGIVQTYVFSRGYTISKFCGKNGNGPLICSDTSGLQSLDLVFMRPNNVSVLTGTQSGIQTPFTCAEIHVSAPQNDAERIIRVSYLGEVSTGQTCI